MPGLVSRENMEGQSESEVNNVAKISSPERALQQNSAEIELHQNVGQIKSPVSSSDQSESEDARKESDVLEGSARVTEPKAAKTVTNASTIKEGKASASSSSKSSGKDLSSDTKKNAVPNRNRSSRPVSINQPKKPPKLVMNSQGSARSSPKGTPKSVHRTPSKSPAKLNTELASSEKSDASVSNLSPNANSSAKIHANHTPSSEEFSPAQRKLFYSPDRSSKKASASPVFKRRISSSGLSKMQKEVDEASEEALDNPDLGPFLLKLARTMIVSGDNPYKALECAKRASKSFEKCAGGEPSLELAMSLHILAAIHCTLEQYEEAIPVLERSIKVPVLEEGAEHALAAFAGNMQLGDTYAMLGQLENSIECYKSGLEIQKQVLGDMDPRVGETCRYLAEAHAQAMQFDEAEKLCEHALNIHREHNEPASPEEVADRRLMALICDGKGDHEAALEHLVLASMALNSSGEDAEVASIDCSIGDTYLALGRFDEAVFAYQKSLTVFKSTKGESHPSVARAFVRLADLYYKTGKLRESKSYCENAMRIYNKASPMHPLEDVASGLTELAAIYEAMDEPAQALRLLQKALKILDDSPGQQGAVAGIEAQMGVIYYVLGKYGDSYSSFKNSVSKLRAGGERKSSFFGVVLNQMGLACVQLCAINEAADLFEESRSVLEEVCGPCHPDTLSVYSNLAGAYDAMGRLEDAIGLLENVVRMREEKLGTANPDVDDEKRRLGELLKEAGRVRNKKPKSLETLIQATFQRKKKDKSK
eukprot:TRINITY_DN991_c0_g1_i1.p1 TRINITY_DN991_c0_g1~~TRINITY_DN991_c0_g1_i1.p1  ORF type:complete len:765 (+),score=188.45 TRINITY_DN991_c0_g1_i1:476-2770(+)